MNAHGWDLADSPNFCCQAPMQIWVIGLFAPQAACGQAS